MRRSRGRLLSPAPRHQVPGFRQALFFPSWQTWHFPEWRRGQVLATKLVGKEHPKMDAGDVAMPAMAPQPASRRVPAVAFPPFDTKASPMESGTPSPPHAPALALP